MGLDDERLLQLELVLVRLVVLDEIEFESLEDENESALNFLNDGTALYHRYDTQYPFS